MDLARCRFNTYLLTLLAVTLLCGCKTTKSDKPETSFRVHPEAKDNSSFTRKVTVFRTTPVTMMVEQSPILTEDQIVDAAVVEALGGFAIQIKFDSRGQWLLDHHTSLNIGRRLALFTTFGEKKTGQARWLAAPIISSRTSDGMLIFTPDATREEAELIVKGLKPAPTKADKESKETSPAFP